MTAREIIEQALAFSSANDPGVTAGDQELLVILNHKLRKYYRIAFLSSPSFFGSLIATPYSGTGWPVPSNSVGVYHIEKTDGTEVHVVPVSERTIVSLPPRVYRLGAVYKSVGETNDPGASDTLTMFFGRKAPAIADLGDDLPDEWPTDHEDLLVVELAHYLALKDKARGDLDEIIDVRKGMISDFVSHVRTAEFSEGRFVANR